MLAVNSAPGRAEVPHQARIIVQPAIPIAGSLSRGREWNISGFQTTHPVPLPRSKTPAEPTFLANDGTVVHDNGSIAVAETEGPEAGLRIVDQLGLDDFRYLHSTRAELLRRLGRTGEARDAYRRARQLTDDGAERRFLERRLTELAGTTGSG